MQKELVCVNSKLCSESLELPDSHGMHPVSLWQIYGHGFANISEECRHRDKAGPRDLRLRDTEAGEGNVRPSPPLLGRMGSRGS